MTVRSHLTHVIFYSLDPLGNLDDPSLNAVIGEPALFVRTLAIPIIGLVALGAAMGVTRYREYITTDES